jgi:serine/threonine-protein kinase
MRPTPLRAVLLTMDPASEPSVTSASSPAGASGKAADPDLTGKTLGDFHLLRRLGQGGMGQVYLAEQLSLQRKVALKLLRADLASDPVCLQRFKVEALAVARATHANIVQVYAVGEAQGLHYMALEYVEGRNLRDYLDTKGPPEVLAALSIMRQVAAALQRAHELGIIHRDIKPENILLTRKTEVKVADFGLSRLLAPDRPALNLTQTNTTMGTPLYMSPEQVECKPLDARSDIYSFGVTCYHMLAGRPPFEGNSPFEVAVQHVQREPVPLAKLRPDMPPELCALVQKMMAKRREDRFQTGREIVKEVLRLRDVLVGVQGGARTAALITTGPTPAGLMDLTATQKIKTLRRRRWLPWVAAVSVLLALGGGLLAGRAYYHREPAPASAPGDTKADAPPEQLPDERKEWEERLVRELKLYANPMVPADQLVGVSLATKLGLLYLRERRLAEAERFFNELSQPEKFSGYKRLGKLGQALVLSFQDRPEESNQRFRAVLPWKGPDKASLLAKQLWQSQPELRLLVAEAANRNKTNAPRAFPVVLEPLRSFPPLPSPKAERPSSSKPSN